MRMLGSLVLLAACAQPVGESTQAITSGMPDDTDTSVVLVVAKVGAQTGYCSGVVVSPHVVLTAAHCSSLDAEYSIFLGADYNDASAKALATNYVAVAEHHPHPDWNSTFNTNDIGVLITSAAMPATPVALNRDPIATADIGKEIRIAGYGEPAGNKMETMGRRNVAVTTIAAVDSASLTVKGLPNICLYDSGGPTFMTRSGTNVVAGIHYLIDALTCDSKGFDVRVDKYTAFIDGYIAMADPVIEDAGVPEDAGVDAPTPMPMVKPAGCNIAGSSTASWPIVLLLFRRRRGSRR